MATAELTDFATVSVRNVGLGQTEGSFPFDEGPSAWPWRATLPFRADYESWIRLTRYEYDCVYIYIA